MEWIDQALFRQVDPELFVGEGHPNVLRHYHRRAIKICNACPVIEQCRAYAMGLARQSPIYGVWGGMKAEDINRQARHPARKKVA